MVQSIPPISLPESHLQSLGYAIWFREKRFLETYRIQTLHHKHVTWIGAFTKVCFPQDTQHITLNLLKSLGHHCIDVAWCVCAVTLQPQKALSLHYTSQTLLPLKEHKMQHWPLNQRLCLLSCAYNKVTIPKPLALGKTHKGCAGYKTYAETHRHDYAHLPKVTISMLFPQGPHLTVSPARQFQLLDPVSTLQVEQTLNQPQEHWLKAKLFIRRHGVKPRMHTTDWVAEVELL